MIATCRIVLMMIRPPVAVVLMLFAALGLAAVGAGDRLHPLFTTVFLTIGGWFIHATVFNDLADEEIDRVNLQNARGRPLVSGIATRRQLLTVGLVAGAVSLITAWLVDPRVGVVVTVGLILNIAYSCRPLQLSSRGFFAVALLPLGYVVLPFLVGAFTVTPSLGGDGVVILVGLYITFMGRIVLKDLRDAVGDERYGKRTFLVRHGRVSTCMLSAACWMIGTAPLIGIVPAGSALIAIFPAYLAGVSHGLYLLSGTSSYAAQQILVGAIANIGRGMGITLLAHLTMVAKGWALEDQTVVHLLLSATFVYMYLETVAQRNTVEVAAIRPY